LARRYVEDVLSELDTEVNKAEGDANDGFQAPSHILLDVSDEFDYLGSANTAPTPTPASSSSPALSGLTPELLSVLRSKGPARDDFIARALRVFSDADFFAYELLNQALQAAAFVQQHYLKQAAPERACLAQLQGSGMWATTDILHLPNAVLAFPHTPADNVLATKAHGLRYSRAQSLRQQQPSALVSFDDIVDCVARTRAHKLPAYTAVAPAFEAYMRAPTRSRGWRYGVSAAAAHAQRNKFLSCVYGQNSKTTHLEWSVDGSHSSVCSTPEPDGVEVPLNAKWKVLDLLLEDSENDHFWRASVQNLSECDAVVSDLADAMVSEVMDDAFSMFYDEN
jgi:hypothetical protein